MLVTLAMLLAAGPSLAKKLPARSQNAKPSIVLVHGAFANASAWSQVIAILERDGYAVTATQDPMSSYADDVATVKRVVDAQTAPVVLVGHSYGGAIISGVSSDKIKALVYVAAFAADEGENLLDLMKKYPSDLGAALVPDSGGYLTIDRSKFHDVFAADLPMAQSNVMAASQGPLKGSIFATTMPAPTWKSVPNWYIVATEDHAINPDLERFYAKRMQARTTELKTSHVAFLADPEGVSKVIEQAASAVASGSF